jgi:hypothetical protein
VVVKNKKWRLKEYCTPVGKVAEVDRGRRRKKMMGDRGGVYARDGKIGGHPSM